MFLFSVFISLVMTKILSFPSLSRLAKTTQRSLQGPQQSWHLSLVPTSKTDLPKVVLYTLISTQDALKIQVLF